MTWIRGCSKFTSIWISRPSQREATSRMRHPCSAGTLRSGGVRRVKDIVDQLRGMISVGCCANSFDQKTTEDADATSWRRCGSMARESVADFVFRFRATCLKIPDLSEVEKLDRFVRALAQDIRLQVELRGPHDFHEAAMFAKRADAVITRVSG